VKEARFGQGACRKFESLKYLAFSTFEHNKPGSVSSRHPCFARKAWLKHSKSLNPGGAVLM
jgi:hypothetical protein